MVTKFIDKKKSKVSELVNNWDDGKYNINKTRAPELIWVSQLLSDDFLSIISNGIKMRFSCFFLRG